MRHLCQTTRTETADKGMVSASCEIFAKQMVDAERYWKSIQQVCLRCNVLQAHTRHAFHCWLKKGFSVLLLLNIFIIYKDIFVTWWSIYEHFVCVCVINVDFSFHPNNNFFPVKTLYIYNFQWIFNEIPRPLYPREWRDFTWSWVGLSAGVGMCRKPRSPTPSP